MKASDSLGGRYRGRTVTVGIVAATLAASSLAFVLPGVATAAAGPALVWSAPATVETAPFGTGTTMYSVACPTASLCLAGDSQGNILTSADPTSGSPTWHKSLVVGQARINALECPSTSFCLAVVGAGGGPDIYTSTDPASGSATWVAARTEVVTGSMTCPSAQFCAAPGKGEITTSANPAAGASSVWKVTSLDGANNITAVSCATVTLCVAVDGAGNVLTSTNPAGSASAWTITNIDGSVGMTGVTCPSTSFCAALDGSGRLLYSTSPVGGASAWHRTTGPATAFPPRCLSATFCTAIGAEGELLTTSDPTRGTANWQTSDIDGTIRINDVSCASTAMCVAVDDRGNALASTNPAGGPSAWQAVTVDGVTSLDSMACPAASLCVAGDNAGNILSSTNPAGGPTTWHAANVEGPHGDIKAISCPSTTLCVAAARQGNVLTSTNPAGGPSAWSVATVASIGIVSVTCPTPTLCVAGDGDGDILSSVNPTGGASAWNAAHIGGPGADLSVSCASSTFCVAIEMSTGTTFTSTNPAGGVSAWQSSAQFPGTWSLGPVACPATTLCVAPGVYQFDGDKVPSPVIFSSADPAGGVATWQILRAGPGDDGVTATSCPDTSFCAVASDEGGLFVSADPAGSDPSSWQWAGFTAGTVACASRSLCVAGTDAGQVSVGVPPVPTQTTITSATGSPVVGQRISVRVQVASTMAGLTTPAGAVTVTDGSQVCAARLSGSAGIATGACDLTEFRPGSYSLSASYPAQGSFAGSQTAVRTDVTVLRAPTATALKLSSGRIVFGHEQREHLTVTVRPRFAGVPAGTVVISARGKVLCRLVLRHASASCSLTGRQLRPGTYRLTARYLGSPSYLGSRSAAMLVTVLRRR